MELTDEQKALIEAQEALRDGRHLIKTVLNQILGGGYEAPEGSNVARVVKRMVEAQALVQKTLTRGIR